MPIRMQIQGIRCAGGVPGYYGTYELYDVKIHAVRPVLGPPTFPGMHEALPARLGVVEVTPDWRRSTRSLFAWAMDGERRDVVITWLRIDRADFRPALTVTLSRAWLWGYSISACGGEGYTPPMEMLSFAFDELTYAAERGGAFTCTVRPPSPEDVGQAPDGGDAGALTTPGMLAEALRRWPTDALLWSALGDHREEAGGVAGAARAREEARALGGGDWWGEVEPL